MIFDEVTEVILNLDGKKFFFKNTKRKSCVAFYAKMGSLECGKDLIVLTMKYESNNYILACENHIETAKGWGWREL